MDIYKSYQRDSLREKLAKLEKEMVEILSGIKRFQLTEQKEKVINELQVEMGEIRKKLSEV